MHGGTSGRPIPAQTIPSSHFHPAGKSLASSKVFTEANLWFFLIFSIFCRHGQNLCSMVEVSVEVPRHCGRQGLRNPASRRVTTTKHVSHSPFFFSSRRRIFTEVTRASSTPAKASQIAF